MHSSIKLCLRAELDNFYDSDHILSQTRTESNSMVNSNVVDHQYHL